MNIKKIAVLIVVATLIGYFAFFENGGITIEGNWERKKIVLDGRELHLSASDSILQLGKEVSINKWTDSIRIPNGKKELTAHFTMEENNGIYYLELSSQEKALNGKFVMEIDTIQWGE